MPRLCYCIQIKFTSSVRNRDDTCFLLDKQAVALVSFPMWVSTRCSGKTLLACFARGFPRVALGTSAGSCRCCVMSPGSRVGITGLMLGLR